MRRREFMAMSAGLLALGAPLRSIARTSLGGGTLTTISDGTLALPLALPQDVPAAELAELSARFGLEPSATTPRPLNVTLWQSGDRTVLFDAGSGPAFVDTAGALYDNLDAVGVALEQVTDVVFTHAHPDHIWGIIDDFDEIAFPEAQLWIGQSEYDYWTDPATTDSLDETRKFFAVGAARRLEAIAGNLTTFADGDEVLPGITARMTPGHTPGHMSFLVSDGGQRALVLGDAATNGHLNFARPDWPSDSDQDREQAAETRARLFRDLAGEATMLIGYHLPGDGLGRVEAEGDGYRFVPL
ncbi:MAG: MBL fold metallo-hydrolase [Silicimonas sp.]|nr:MBL fold metallo-hydrolase [Silicimonas sp.]